MEYTEIQLDGLASGEKAYSLTTGEKVAVQVTRDVLTGSSLQIKVRARKVTDTGNTGKVAGVEVVVPEHLVSMRAAGFDKQPLVAIISTVTGEAIGRVLEYEAALEAWSTLPVDTEK